MLPPRPSSQFPGSVVGFRLSAETGLICRNGRRFNPSSNFLGTALAVHSSRLRLAGNNALLVTQKRIGAAGRWAAAHQHRRVAVVSEADSVADFVRDHIACDIGKGHRVATHGLDRDERLVAGSRAGAERYEIAILQGHESGRPASGRRWREARPRYSHCRQSSGGAAAGRRPVSPRARSQQDPGGKASRFQQRYGSRNRPHRAPAAPAGRPRSLRRR